jgi:hypothetical protein
MRANLCITPAPVHEVMVQRVAELLGCVVKHTPTRAMRVEVASQAHHAGVTRVVIAQRHCPSPGADFLRRCLETFDILVGHFGPYQIRQMPVARSAPELWARTHETARAPRRGKRLIESMVPDLQCQSISARSKPDRYSGRLDRRQRNRSWLNTPDRGAAAAQRRNGVS